MDTESTRPRIAPPKKRRHARPISILAGLVITMLRSGQPGGH